MRASNSMIELDPEEKQKRIEGLMDHTKEEIVTQWVALGSDMKEKYDKLKVEFIGIKWLMIFQGSLKISDQKNQMKYLEVKLELPYRVISCI